VISFPGTKIYPRPPPADRTPAAATGPATAAPLLASAFKLVPSELDLNIKELRPIELPDGNPSNQPLTVLTRITRSALGGERTAMSSAPHASSPIAGPSGRKCLVDAGFAPCCVRHGASVTSVPDRYFRRTSAVPRGPTQLAIQPSRRRSVRRERTPLPA